MGFLSSLFGSSKSKPATTTNVMSQKLPEEIAPFAKEVLTDAQKLYKSNVEQGYQPYTGKTIAPFTPEQEQAMAGISGLVGTSRPLQEEALEAYRRGGDQFTAEVAEQFMSPYQRAVTDIEKRKAQENFEANVMPKFEAQAVQQGAMSGLGSRAGVQAAELQRGQSQLLSDIEARGQQKAFEDARKGFEQQQARQRQMAGDVAALGPAMFASGLQEQGALQSIGEQKQQLGQSAMDEAYYKFLEEQQFPQQQLANYSGFVYGNPAAGMVNTNQTGSSTPFQPSFGQQLLGAGLQLGGAYLSRPTNIYSGKPPGMAAGGGGIAGLINKANGGGFEDEMAMGIEEQVEVPAPTPTVDPAQVGKDRTEVIKNLALQGGSFPGIFTPEEVTQQAEEKKARRAAVMGQIVEGKGQLTLGKVMMAFGSAIGKGGGIEISKSLDALTQQLMAERKDLSKLEAQNLLANLDIDELAIDTIRQLPKQVQLVLMARKEAKGKDDLRKSIIAKNRAAGKTKPMKKFPAEFESDAGKARYNQAQKHIVTMGENMKKNPQTAALGELISDLKVDVEATVIDRAYEKFRISGGDMSIQNAVKQTVLDMIKSKEITPDSEAVWWWPD